MKTKIELLQAIENHATKSAWTKGVKLYAYELVEMVEDNHIFYANPLDKKLILNGASDWSQYSHGGCALIYNGDIAERLANPSEYKKSKEGQYNPNRNETWLDWQSSALYQAERLIMRLIKREAL